MILPRSFYNDSPPERRTRVANNPTLLYSWWCTIFSLVIIGFRLSGRYIRNERLFREDKVMAASIIPLIIRMSLVHVVLIYGTNNVDTEGLIDPDKIHNREIGSKAVLAARIFYALYIWMAKYTVSEFLKRMTERFWKPGYELCLRLIRGFLIATFVGVFIATLAECQPFTHYWQVVPDPGPKCRQGYAHLLVMGVTDIVTDVLLIIFPIPVILNSGIPLRRKLSLTALFSMSLILIAITGARIPLVIQRNGIQQFRTVFASSEILAASFVANAIILGSFLRDRGIKKARYKGGSTNDSMDRRSSTRRPTLEQLGSDEDLARSLGYRTNPDLVEKKTSLPKPAPVANLDLLAPPKAAHPLAGSKWQFPQKDGSTDHSKDTEPNLDPTDEPLPSPRAGRRVSFMDAGGLLDDSSHPSSAPSPTASVATYDFAVSQPRRTSRASSFINPGGRAYHPQNRRPSRLSQQSEDYGTSSRSSQQLQDVSGLLSQTPESAPPQGNLTSASAHRMSVDSSAKSPSYGTLPSIQDAGGLLKSSTSESLPSMQDVGGLLYPTNSPSLPSIQDAGGLLNSSSSAFPERTS